MGALFPILFDAPTKINYNSYVKTLNPLLWLKFTESAGNIVNYGSEGGTGTVTNCTQGQTGKLGPQQAYLFNGTTSGVSFAIAALPNLKNVTTQAWAFLVNATSLGEGSQGDFFEWKSGGTFLNFANLNRLSSIIKTTGTNPTNATVNNAVSSMFGKWAWIFLDYDDSNAMGLGRRIRLFLGLSGSVSLLALGTDTPATGAIVPQVDELWIGNRFVFDKTFDGSIDEVLARNTLWTPTTSPTDKSIMQAIVNTSGV